MIKDLDDMNEKVKGLLQKINFIETDMELHKQILAAIPSDQRDEMEKVIRTIAGQKEQIQALRQEIKTADEASYNQILAIEQGTQAFRQLAREKKFVAINAPDEKGACFLTLNSGDQLACLVTAEDEAGNWTVLTLEGEIKEYPGGLIQKS